MTMLEKMIAKAEKDIEKARKGVERTSKWGEKKADKCRKLDCLWTQEEMWEHRDNGTMTDAQYSAYFDYICNKRDIEDYERQLTRAYKRLDIILNAAEDKAKEQEANDHIDAMANRYEIRTITKEEYEKWLAEFKAECAKDGITIEDANNNFIHGLTKSGKGFAMYINNGFTDRSWHSYTLTINGDTIFTSGLFGTGYRYLMAH